MPRADGEIGDTGFDGRCLMVGDGDLSRIWGVQPSGSHHPRPGHYHPGQETGAVGVHQGQPLRRQAPAVLGMEPALAMMRQTLHSEGHSQCDCFNPQPRTT